MKEIDDIQGSMEAAKEWGDQGPEYRQRAKDNSTAELRKLVLLLAKLNGHPNITEKVEKIVATYDSI